jgi:gliding-associated putative ABC transporter substrate-binding component GldG
MLIAGLILVNYISSKATLRIDLTEDKRYTLSEPAKQIIQESDDLVQIKVYLKGNFPSDFKRLQLETELFLKELKSVNKKVHFRFIDPGDLAEELMDGGLEPSRLQIEEDGGFTEIFIFPWAVINYKGKTENVHLLKDIIADSPEEQIENSIQNLEYAFVNAIHKLNSEKSDKIAILKGNGELEDIYLADILRKLGDYYYTAPFTLENIEKNEARSLKELINYELVIIAKPTKKFSEKEKYLLDQYVMNGGKSLWLIDNVHAELDSLMKTGEAMAFSRDLGLTDLFFNYGVRINHDLITDLYSSQITLATGNIGNNPQFDQFPWKYFPLINSKNNHPINTNIEMVHARFANSMDLLKNDVKKTVLLQSSDRSKPIGVPSIVSLNSVGEQPKINDFNNGNKPMAVLLEGKLKSAYSGRIKPFQVDSNMDRSEETKMVVISDGDLIANEIYQGQPLELGLEKITNQKFGNKEFVVNTVNYLLDDTGLMDIRSKKIKIDYLDRNKSYVQAGKWQLINILFPIILLSVFGFLFHFLRKKKYQ